MKNAKNMVSRILSVFALVAVIAPSVGHSQAVPSRSLQAIDYAALDGEGLMVTLTLSGPAPEPAVFTIDKPARISLDLPDTGLAVAERFKKVNVGKVRAVAAAEAKGRTRVVMELIEMAAYTVKIDGQKIFINIGGSQMVGAALSAPTVAGRLDPAITGSSIDQIKNIDFRRGEKGEGRVIVTMSNAKSPVDVGERDGKIAARFRNVEISNNLQRRLDVLDFATPVKFVDVARDGVNVNVTLTPAAGADFEQVAYQAGNVFTIELHPLTKETVERRQREKPQFTGERITLSFQSVDIRSLLQIVADVAGTNMVVSDSVAGELAMRLENVPWDQALDIILKTKGLGMRQQGNVMLVAPMAELAEREKVEMESAKQIVELAPLRSELIQVNYAKASEMAALLKSTNNSLLTARGNISVDDRTNTLIVLETREKLSEIRQLLNQLDIPVRQVLIESRIVTARNDFRKSLGSRFGVSQVATNGGQGLFSTSGTIASTNNTVTDFTDDSPGFPVEFLSGIPSLNVNLPTVGGAAGSIAFALIGSDYILDLELSALQAEGRGEVISTPRVVTANGKEALIEQGREIPYLEASSSGAATINFKKAVLSLLVTPQITPDNRILMDLKVTNDAQGENVALGLGSAPSIDTRRMNTQVLIKTGETVVLGGVLEHETLTNKTKVPLLGDIPLFGHLFRNNSSSDNKRELLIFVTPKILNEGLAIR